MITFFITALMLLLPVLFLPAIYLNAPAIVFKEYGNFSWVFSIYIINSVITYIFYAYDKNISIKNGKDKEKTGGKKQKKRIPEVILHFSEFLGGWPGGVIARPLLNHKTNWNVKREFIIKSWLIIFAHLAFWIWYFFLQ